MAETRLTFRWLDEDHHYHETADRDEAYAEAGGNRIQYYREIKCCGNWYDANRFTITCDTCGADYNSSGQRLAPRSQWGEETGEQWWECY